MRVVCRAIDPDGHFKTVEEEKALAAWRDGQGPFWIDLENQDRGPMAAWLGKLGIDQELVDLMRAAAERHDHTRLFCLPHAGSSCNHNAR